MKTKKTYRLIKGKGLAKLIINGYHNRWFYPCNDDYEIGFPIATPL